MAATVKVRKKKINELIIIVLGGKMCDNNELRLKRVHQRSIGRKYNDEIIDEINNDVL